MIIGCFALIEPFSPMRRQFELIRKMGFDYADLTDNHNGAALGAEYGLAASLSLDSHQDDMLGRTNEFGLPLTTCCANAKPFESFSPAPKGGAGGVNVGQQALYTDTPPVLAPASAPARSGVTVPTHGKHPENR